MLYKEFRNSEIQSIDNCDALILQTNKNLFKSSTEYREKILKTCGDKLLDEFKVLDALSLSECVVTNGYNLNFKKIIHVVLPKFTNIYQNACESSLHLATRNILDVINIFILDCFTT